MSEPITDVECTRKRHAIECPSCFENREIGPVVIGHCRADPQRAELLQTTVLTNGCRANSKLAAAVAKQMRACCHAGSLGIRGMDWDAIVADELMATVLRKRLQSVG